MNEYIFLYKSIESKCSSHNLIDNQSYNIQIKYILNKFKFNEQIKVERFINSNVIYEQFINEFKYSRLIESDHPRD